MKAITSGKILTDTKNRVSNIIAVDVQVSNGVKYML